MTQYWRQTVASLIVYCSILFYVTCFDTDVPSYKQQSSTLLLKLSNSFKKSHYMFRPTWPSSSVTILVWGKLPCSFILTWSYSCSAMYTLVCDGTLCLCCLHVTVTSQSQSQCSAVPCIRWFVMGHCASVALVSQWPITNEYTAIYSYMGLQE
jgi:hypothetical protein